jgi:hypothetical protein
MGFACQDFIFDIFVSVGNVSTLQGFLLDAAQVAVGEICDIIILLLKASTSLAMRKAGWN